ncbi:hypothetical protein ASV53_22850 [Photobacterium sanguinicancri]|uniref:TyrR-like helix-turn-helix domain-containing protein n=1 Tax=Photobacterium sanguinicancri TaxID=875932 RepID=A0ABX4FRS5_9GAMM|nr:hypothetical protein ASV53_22850 [Photobacterium sanguinicancri]
MVDGRTFKSRSAAARHYGLEPKLVNERMTKRGWTLSQALELEPRPTAPYRKGVVIDGIKYSSMREAARKLGVAQSTLMNRIKAGIAVEDALSVSHGEREKLKGQSKPMFYQGKLYPSARHLLLAKPALVINGDLNKTVTALNDKARRAKNKCEIENLSLDEVSTEYGLAKVRFVDEFDGLRIELLDEEVLNGLFYELK